MQKGFSRLDPSQTELIKKVLIFFILAVTFLMAVKQIGPFDSVDEKMVANWAWQMHDDPFPVNQYPPLMLYLHFFLSLIYEQILMLFGFINNHLEFIQSGYGYRFMVEAGRIIIALFATGMVYFTYRTAKDFYNDGVAFAAALILSFNQVFLLHAHIFKTDIAASFFLTVALYFMLKFHSWQRRKDFFKAGIFSGLAIATKYNVFPLVFVLVLLIFLVRKKMSKPQLKQVWLLLPLSSAAGFFIAAPNWLVHPIANLKLFFQAYSPGSGAVFQFGIGGKASPPQIFLKIFGNLFTYFGPMLVVVFILAIGLSIVKKNQRDILMITAFGLYVLVFMPTGFYADRFCIPLYGIFSLMAAKVFFEDFPMRARRFKIKWPLFAVVFWGLLTVYAGQNLFTNVYTFNQLKTQSKDQWVQSYRFDHYLTNQSSQTYVGSQHQTPRFPGDIRLRRVFITKGITFNSRAPFKFILANNKYFKIFASGREILSKRAVDLSFYRPFLYFKKEKYQPWDYDYLFLYKISPQLRSITTRQREVALPRIFSQGDHTTYLPLQRYQKGPLFLKLNDTFLNHWLYSKKALQGLTIYLYKGMSPQSSGSVILSVNGREYTVERFDSFGFKQVDIHNIMKKRFYRDHVYQLEVKKSNKHPLYMVISPRYVDENQLQNDRLTGLNPPFQEPIPPLFDSRPYPLWIKRFYQKTGLDLTLLQHLNRFFIYINKMNSLDDVNGDFFPLQQGYYYLKILGRPIYNNQPPGSAHLQLTINNKKSSSKRVYAISGEFPVVIPLEIKEKLAFIKVDLLSLAKNNLLVKEVILTADYRKYIEEKIIRPSN